MKGAPSYAPATPSAWMKVRLKAIVLAAVLMAGGVSLVLLSFSLSQPLLAQAVGAVLGLAAALVLAIRPWALMRRMEMQLMVRRGSLSPTATARRQDDPSGEENPPSVGCGSCGTTKGGDARCPRGDEQGR